MLPVDAKNCKICGSRKTKHESGICSVCRRRKKSSPVYSVRRTRDGGRDRTMQKVNRGKNYTCLIIKIDFSPENRRLTYGFMQILSW